VDFSSGSRLHHAKSVNTLLSEVFFLHLKCRKKKNLVNKIMDENPSIKSSRQKRTQVNTTQRKNKSKQLTKIK
jgi:hypothetical protein